MQKTQKSLLFIAFISFFLMGVVDGKSGCGSYSYQQCKPGETGVCPGPKEVGACSNGTRTCLENATWGECKGVVEAADKEECDGKDNDCNGKVDDIPNKECYSGAENTAGVGLCKKGTQTCKDGAWTSCEGEVIPATDDACDGKDNNCNGKIDETCNCKPNETQECGQSTQGECKKGTQTCDNNGKWGECKGEVKSQQEVCDGKDNDCNGTVDDNTNDCKQGETCTSGKCETDAATPIRTGGFQDAVHKVSGSVSIFKEKNGERIVLSQDFKTESGPDLFVYLIEDAKGDAKNSKFVNLGKLPDLSGSHTFTYNGDSSKFKSVGIWCKAFSVNFGYATLKP